MLSLEWVRLPLLLRLLPEAEQPLDPGEEERHPGSFPDTADWGQLETRSMFPGHTAQGLMVRFPSDTKPWLRVCKANPKVEGNREEKPKARSLPSPQDPARVS